MRWKKGNNKKGWLQRIQKLKVLFVYVHCQTFSTIISLLIILNNGAHANSF